MFTIIETQAFSDLWPDYWDEDERGEFAACLAVNPLVGDVIPKSGGCRKVRWSRQGSGKSGGVRVIHYNRLANGHIYLPTMYAKSAKDSIPGKVLAKLRERLDEANQND